MGNLILCGFLVIEALGIFRAYFYFENESLLLNHLLTIILVALFVNRDPHIKRALHLRALSVVLVVVLPLVGVVFLWLALYAIRRPQSTLKQRASLANLDSEVSEWLRSDLVSKRVYQEQTGNQLASVQPFSNILHSTDFISKTHVIARLRGFQDNFEKIRLLKLARTDKDYDIQYLATMALTKIEKEWAKDIKELEERIDFDPLDSGLYSKVVYAHMLAYGTGIVSPEVARIHFKSALTYIDRGLSLNPKETDLYVQRGKVCLAQRRYAEALEAFSKALELAPDQSRIRIWRAEALYLTHNFEQLRGECTFISKGGVFNLKTEPVVRYWAEQSRGAA